MKYSSFNSFWKSLFDINKKQKSSHRSNRQTSNLKMVFASISVFICSLFSISCNAILSQSTANLIYGNPPYLTFDGGKTKATNTEHLLSITMSDGKNKTIYTNATNPSSSANPIELPVLGQTFENVEMFVPVGKSSVDLNDLISEPYHYWGDEDGDGNVTATGTLSLTIKDADGNNVNRTDNLSLCNAPYQITLSSTDGTLSTEFGYPNRTEFIGGNAVYYVTPKKGKPLACFAKPNL